MSSVKTSVLGGFKRTKQTHWSVSLSQSNLWSMQRIILNQYATLTCCNYKLYVFYGSCRLPYFCRGILLSYQKMKPTYATGTYSQQWRKDIYSGSYRFSNYLYLQHYWENSSLSAVNYRLYTYCTTVNLMISTGTYYVTCAII